MHRSGIQKRLEPEPTITPSPAGGGDTVLPKPPIVPSSIPVPKPISPLALAPALAPLELFHPTYYMRSSIGFVHVPYNLRREFSWRQDLKAYFVTAERFSACWPATTGVESVQAKE